MKLPTNYECKQMTEMTEQIDTVIQQNLKPFNCVQKKKEKKKMSSGSFENVVNKKKFTSPIYLIYIDRQDLTLNNL